MYPLINYAHYKYSGLYYVFSVRTKTNDIFLHIRNSFDGGGVCVAGDVM